MSNILTEINDFSKEGLKKTDTVVKDIPPTAEDCHRERAPLDAANFDKTNLKKTTTQESVFLEQEKSILAAANFDKSQLKPTETKEGLGQAIGVSIAVRVKVFRH